MIWDGLKNKASGVFQIETFPKIFLALKIGLTCFQIGEGFCNRHPHLWPHIVTCAPWWSLCDRVRPWRYAKIGHHKLRLRFFYFQSIFLLLVYHYGNNSQADNYMLPLFLHFVIVDCFKNIWVNFQFDTVPSIPNLHGSTGLTIITTTIFIVCSYFTFSQSGKPLTVWWVILTNNTTLLALITSTGQ